MSTTITVPDETMRELAKALAPFMAAELAKLKPVSAPPSGNGPRRDYDDATCAMVVDGLGNDVLIRADAFFSEIAKSGEIEARDLVALTGLKSGRSIAAAITNPFKKRAYTLGLGRALPWKESATPDNTRTIWQDRDGIAGRMVKAVRAERAERGI